MRVGAPGMADWGMLGFKHGWCNWKWHFTLNLFIQGSIWVHAKGQAAGSIGACAVPGSHYSATSEAHGSDWPSSQMVRC